MKYGCFYPGCFIISVNCIATKSNDVNNHDKLVNLREYFLKELRV